MLTVLKLLKRMVNNLGVDPDEWFDNPLDTMLGSIADYYLSELEERLDGLTAAIEPIVTIVIGIFVAGFGASILLPMFKMYEVAM